MKKLIELRKKKKISQGELANQIKISQQSISSYENNTREPDIETLIKLADFFEVSIDYLVGRNNENIINEKITLPTDEVKMLNAYRKCSQAGKQYLINKAEVIAFEEKAEDQAATTEKEELLA